MSVCECVCMCRLEDSMPPFLTALQFISVQFSPVDHRPLPFSLSFFLSSARHRQTDLSASVDVHHRRRSVLWRSTDSTASVQVQFSNLAFTFPFLFYPDINNSLETAAAAAAAVSALCDRLMLCNEANEVGRKKEREREGMN